MIFRCNAECIFPSDGILITDSNPDLNIEVLRLLMDVRV